MNDQTNCPDSADLLYGLLGFTRVHSITRDARRRARLRKKWLRLWLKDRHNRAARAKIRAWRAARLSTKNEPSPQ